MQFDLQCAYENEDVCMGLLFFNGLRDCPSKIVVLNKYNETYYLRKHHICFYSRICYLDL